MFQVSYSSASSDERTIVELGDGLRESSDSSIVEAGDAARDSSAGKTRIFRMVKGCIVENNKLN